MNGVRRWMAAVVFGVAVAALPAWETAPVSAQPAKTEAYRLSPEESDRLRGFEGKTFFMLWASDDVWTFVSRVFANVAGKTQLDPKQTYNRKYTFLRKFHESLGPPDPVEIVNGRFLFTSACEQHNCPHKAAFVADLTTGHVAMALLHDTYGVDTVRKACASDELKIAAEARFRAWAKEAYSNSYSNFPNGDGVPWRQVETPCRADVVEPSYQPEPSKPVVKSSLPVDRLVPSELAVIRGLAGRPSYELLFNKSAQAGIRRVFHGLADRAGFYSGEFTNNPSTFDLYGRLFSETATRLIDERFLVTGDCDGRGAVPCWQVASMAVDLVSGDVAFAMVHRFNADGTVFYERGRLTIFMRACATDDLRGFARTYFPAWAKSELRRLYGEDVGSVEKPSILSRRCA